MSSGSKPGEATVLPGRRWLTYGLMLVMGALWGLAIALAKWGTIHGGHPFGLALWQATGGGLLLLLLSLINRRPPSLAFAVLRFNLVCGFVGLVIPAVSLFWSAIYLPAGLVSIAFAVMPLLTYGLAAVCRIEAPERRRLFGVLLGLSGVLLLILPDSALPRPGLVPWVLLALAASFSMSVENVYIAARRPPKVDSLTLSCGRQLTAAVMLAPLALLSGATIPLWEAWGPLQWIATGMALCSAGAYTIFLTVIHGAGTVFASQTAYLITLAGIFWGMVLFDESHSAFIWGALALLLCGLTLVRPRPGAAR